MEQYAVCLVNLDPTIRTIDKSRVISKLGKLNSQQITEVKNILNEMLIE